jgi:hypothetical protein
VACHLADCCYELSDCHHSLLRRIEKWIHGIGTGSLSIPTQTAHAEGQRLGQILLGYALGLDYWLSERPMHFLQMDLSHLDLGFDPWPDISRVYAHLGEDHAPVKIWLAGVSGFRWCLNRRPVCINGVGVIRICWSAWNETAFPFAAGSMPG